MEMNIIVKCKSGNDVKLTNVKRINFGKDHLDNDILTVVLNGNGFLEFNIEDIETIQIIFPSEKEKGEILFLRGNRICESN